MSKIPNIEKETTSINQRPFLGLRSYDENNKSQFGGRDKEINDLYDRIENRGLTIVFGKSGIGKTSLIKAGLMPQLRQNFYISIYARIDYSSSKSPLQQLQKIIYEELKSKDPKVIKIETQTLWEYFHDIRLIDDLWTPILILDQFEEIFTLGGENIRNIQELIIELSDLAENRIPLQVQKKYQNNNETVPTHYAERNFRVVLSLREDYLPRLEELKRYIPSIMDSRFRVLQMSVNQAMDAAVKPGKGLIDEAVAKEIIVKLPGVSQSDFELLDQENSYKQNLKIEPFLLSLICDRINEIRIEKKLETITYELVSEFNVEGIIYSFYNETIAKFNEKVECAIEDNLLTENGFRKLQALDELQTKYNITDKQVDDLVDARIVRKEIRDGVEYVELIHDVLTSVIKEKRNERSEKEKEEKRRQIIVESRKKEKKRIIQFSSVIIIIVITVLGWALYSQHLNAEMINRNEKMALARNLITQAQSVGSYEGNWNKAALLSRTAFLIFDKAMEQEAGEDMYIENFYNSMYTTLIRLNERLEISLRKEFKAMVYIEENNSYIIGLRNALVEQIYVNSLMLPVKTDTLYRIADATTRVTSMARYKTAERDLLAMVGMFDSIIIHDIKLNHNFKKIRIPNSIKQGKYVAFKNDGTLLLLQEAGISMWNIDTGKPLVWQKRVQKKWIDSIKNTQISKSKIDWGKSSLQIPDKELNCVSVFKDSLIAIGIKGGIIVLKDDEFKELIIPKLGKLTALKFNSTGDSLIMGNEKGEVFSMNMVDYIVKSHQSHISKITDIIFSPIDHLIATGSTDGTVVLWNKEWTALPLTTRALNRTLGAVNNISYTADGQYIIASYADGTILKWPSSMKVITDRICEVAIDSLTENDWKYYVNRNDLKLQDYACEKKK